MTRWWLLAGAVVTPTNPALPAVALKDQLEESGAVAAIQDMGAAGLTSSSVEMAGKGGVGIELNLDKVPQRETGMTAYEMMLSESQERMLAVRLRDIDRGREVIVASFHAAPLTALNSLRRKQIEAALGELSTLGDKLPILMVGDYNYPVFKENLGQKVREAGYELTLSDARTYTRYKFFKGHYDFATSVGFDIDAITTLPQGRSDHLPILVTATPKTASIV